jgi:hypothetical protein
MMRIGRDLVRGAGLALPVGLACALAARFVRERPHAQSLLLAAAMVAMLLGAWLIHLKADGFFGRALEKPPTGGDREAPAAGPFAAPFIAYGEDVLERHDSGAWTAQELLRALLWSALLLGLASVLPSLG